MYVCNLSSYPNVESTVVKGREELMIKFIEKNERKKKNDWKLCMSRPSFSFNR